MDRMDVEAVYEQGALKLPRALPLADGQKVTITIHPTETAVDRLYGLLPWRGSPEDLAYLLGPDNHPWADEE